ncbi:MAG: peptidoglycan DD-metalloendopeptidase family protein [Microcoleaceae cyanobacterium]
MKGTVPNSDLPVGESGVINCMPQVCTSQRAGVSCSDSKGLTSAAILGLAIVSGMILPEGGQAAPEVPSSDLANSDRPSLSQSSSSQSSVEPDTDGISDSDAEWQPALLKTLLSESQSSSSSPVGSSEAEAPAASTSSKFSAEEVSPAQAPKAAQSEQLSTEGLQEVSESSEVFSPRSLVGSPETGAGYADGSAVPELEFAAPAPSSLGGSQGAEVSGAVLIEPELTSVPVSMVYQVRSGETLAQIAESHDVSIQQIVSANQLSDEDFIVAGQKLKLPQSPTVSDQKSTTSDSRFSKFSQFQEPDSSSEGDRFDGAVSDRTLASKQKANVAELKLSGVEMHSAVVLKSPSSELPVQGYQFVNSEDYPVLASESYADRLRSEVSRLREEYAIQKDTSLEASDSVGTDLENSDQSSPDVDALISTSVSQPLRRRINPEFDPEVYDRQKMAAVDKGERPKTLSELSDELASNDTSTPEVAQALTSASSQESTVAAAPRDPDAYNLLDNPAIGRIVSPDLPPMLGPDSYLPGGSSRFNGYIWPAEGVLTSGYGWRWGRMHRGIDVAGPIGTPIVAAAPGVVVYAGWNSGGYGYLVEIEHTDGSVTLYAHNNSILVNKGQKVAQGQQIAEMGSTGRSTGPHLHFEIHPSGNGAVNPMALLPEE